MSAHDDTLTTTVQDGKTIAALDDLTNWDKNPREVSDQDIARLAQQITDLGVYKPLLVNTAPDVAPVGAVIGGNMRLRALRQLGEEHVWVSPLAPETEDELLEYALSDNDRVGNYTEEGMADLLSGREIDISQYKVDFYAPQDLAQSMARAMDPESLVDLQQSDPPDTDSDGDPSDDADPTPRSIENIAQQANTAMVQLYMTGDEKEAFMEDVQALKRVYGVDTSSDVAQLAAADARAYHDDTDTDTGTAADDEEPPATHQ